MEVDGADPALRFAALGPLRIWRDDQVLDLGPGKQRAVLAVLLLDANRAVPASRIVEAVWDDDPPENGANVVQKYVAGLRRVLEPERSPRTPSQVLTLTDGGYRLHVGEFDVQTFQAGVRRAESLRRGGDPDAATAELRGVLELWRGQPLAGLSGRWFDARRQQLADQYAAAWESLAELELELGRHTGLTTELGRLVGEYPGREGLRAALMLALYRSGRQVEALSAYRDAQDHLREEFGVDPGDQLRELHQRILSSDPTLMPVATAPVSAIPITNLPPPDPVPDSPHVWFTPPHRPAPPPQQQPVVSFLPVGPAPVPMAPPVLPPYLSPQHPVRPFPLITWMTSVKAGLFAAIVFFTCGFGAAPVIGYLAWRRRSVPNGVAAAFYGALNVLLVVSALLYPDESLETGALTIWDGIIVPTLAIPTLFAPVHAFALVITEPDRHVIRPPASTNDVAERMDRERALQILTHHPEMARELRIGRPDLPRWYSDGGLVDVNAVPAYVIARVPGVTFDQVARIMADRGTRGEFQSVYDLVIRHPDLRDNAAALHRFVVIGTPQGQMSDV